MTKRHLEIFSAVVELGKMNEAAKRLYITQSSVSQAIAEIEKEFDVLLFERRSRSLFLTETGKNFYAYVRRALDLQSEMESYLRTCSARRKVRIGATITVGTCVISPMITALKEKIPAVQAEVCVANTHILEEKLLCNELDVGLVEGRIRQTCFRVEPAIPDTMVVICAKRHPFYGRERISMHELANEPLILREKGSGTRAHLENQMYALRLPVNVVWECCNTQAILRGVIDGHGVSVLSMRLVADYIARGELWACSVEDADLSRSFDLVLHRDKVISPEIQAFWDICHEFDRL